MYRKSFTWIVVVAIAIVPLFSTWATAVARNGSGFPDSITVDELASGDVGAPTTAPGSLSLERVTLPTGASLAARQVASAEVLYVERGTLTLVDNLGLTSTLAAAKSVHLHAGASYEASNASKGDVSFLRLSLAASGANASPVAAPSKPVLRAAVVTTLAGFTLTALPKSPAKLFLDRATWKAGVDSGPYTQNGPIGMLVESGTLTISSPSGLDGQLGKGKAVLLPTNQPLGARNDGLDNAVVLLFGVIPASGTAVTAAPGATTANADTNGSTASTGTVLYQADSSGGFEGWAKAGGWQTVSGMLVNDGTSDQPVFAAAPFEASTPDYAIEVEMQWVRGGKTFGVVARGGKVEKDTTNSEDDGGYWIGGNWNGCDDKWNLVAWAGPARQDCNLNFNSQNGIAGTDTVLDTDWHTYRIEVQGNTIRVFLDGTKVIETTDNRYLTSGKVGVWSTGAQVNIRRFTVTALGD